MSTPYVFQPLAICRTFRQALANWRQENPGTLLDAAAIVAGGQFADVGNFPLVVWISCDQLEAVNKHEPATRVWKGEVSANVDATRDTSLDDAQALAETVAQALAEEERAGRLAEIWEYFASETMFELFPSGQGTEFGNGVLTLSTRYAVKLQPAEAAQPF